MALHLRFPNVQTLTLTLNRHTNPRPLAPILSIPVLLSTRHSLPLHHRRSTTRLLASVDQEETQLPVASDELQDASPEDLECVKDIQRVGIFFFFSLSIACFPSLMVCWCGCRCWIF